MRRAVPLRLVAARSCPDLLGRVCALSLRYLGGEDVLDRLAPLQCPALALDTVLGRQLQVEPERAPCGRRPGQQAVHRGGRRDLLASLEIDQLAVEAVA